MLCGICLSAKSAKADDYMHFHGDRYFDGYIKCSTQAYSPIFSATDSVAAGVHNPGSFSPVTQGVFGTGTGNNGIVLYSGAASKSVLAVNTDTNVTESAFYFDHLTNKWFISADDITTTSPVITIDPINARFGVGCATPVADVHLHDETDNNVYITTDEALGGNYAAVLFASDYNGTPNWAGIGQRNDGALALTGGSNLASPDAWLDDNGDFGIASNTAPATAGVTGVTGTIRWAAGYIYVCTSENSWGRAALSAW